MTEQKRIAGEVAGSAANPLHLTATRDDILAVLKRWELDTCGACGVLLRSHAVQGHDYRGRPFSVSLVRRKIRKLEDDDA